MKAWLNPSVGHIETLEIYSRFGGDPYIPEIQSYGYGKGLNKPVSTSAGGFLFFTDSAGNLWKYDYINDSVYPMGLANEHGFINHRFTPKQVVDFPVVARATCTAFYEVAGDPWMTVEGVDIIHDTMLGNYVPDGRLKNAIVWVCGFPFLVKSAVDNEDDTFELELDFFELSYFYFPYASYADWLDTGPLHTGKLPMTVCFSQDTTSYNTDFFFDNHHVSAGAAESETMVDGYSAGNLDGEYEYVFTLVTRHGYESNWCGPFTVKIINGQCKILISCRINTFPSQEFTGDYLNFADDYIRGIRVYRSNRDAKGAWYFLTELPFGSSDGNWELVVSLQIFWRTIAIDNKGDEFLGEAIHPWKLTPNYAISLASTKNTLAVAVPEGVYISEVGNPETFYQYIPFPSGVVAVDAIPYFDEIIVFCKSEIFAVNIFDYSVKPLSVGIGLIGKSAKAVLNDRIIFMAPGGGIYQFAGGKPELIPGFDKIKDILTGKSMKRVINRQNLETTFFIHQPKENKIWCIVGENGKFGNMVIAVSLDRPVFEIYTFPVNLVSGVCFENAGDFIVLLSDEDGNLFSFNTWARGDEGVPIPFLIETAQLGAITDELRIRRLIVEAISDTDFSMVVSGSYDREAYRSEGVINFESSARGDERGVNTYNLVVPTYQFKMETEVDHGFRLTRFAMIFQPKKNRVRPWR